MSSNLAGKRIDRRIILGGLLIQKKVIHALKGYNEEAQSAGFSKFPGTADSTENRICLLCQ